MSLRYTADELNKCSKADLKLIVLSMQDQLNQMNDNLEKLMEQIRIANQDKYGRHSERLDVLEGQLSFFNETEYLSEEEIKEPSFDDVIPSEARKKKTKGRREEDLKDLPTEEFRHAVSEAELKESFGEGNWRRMPDEIYKRLRYEPASWTVEIHTVEVYVGTDGNHQDEFLRGDRPADLLRNSIVTPSLEAAVMNAKYVNSIPLYRIEQEFQRNGINISRQTMANWTILCADRYLKPLYDRLHTELIKYHVSQSDETPVKVHRDGRPAGSQSYMWVHRSGEFYKERPIVLYEYQKTRHHDHPKEFYKDFQGILVTDGLQQYHLIEQEISGLTSANCWAHARRPYADAVKAIGKADGNAIKKSIAYQALTRIAAIYKLEEGLKELPFGERLIGRQKSVKPLVEEYFTWIKERLADTSALPKGKTAEGLKYSVKQEQYLKVFLNDGEVPIDNSASERSIRTFCIGKKNWVLIDSIKGAKASAIIYSISETAKLNNLNPYYYFNYLLTELPKMADTEGNIAKTLLDDLLPWSDKLPEICYRPRR